MRCFADFQTRDVNSRRFVAGNITGRFAHADIGRIGGVRNSRLSFGADAQRERTGIRHGAEDATHVHDFSGGRTIKDDLSREGRVGYRHAARASNLSRKRAGIDVGTVLKAHRTADGHTINRRASSHRIEQPLTAMAINLAVALRRIIRIECPAITHAICLAHGELDLPVAAQLSGEILRPFDAALPLVCWRNAIFRDTRKARTGKIDIASHVYICRRKISKAILRIVSDMTNIRNHRVVAIGLPRNGKLGKVISTRKRNRVVIKGKRGIHGQDVRVGI